MGIKGLTQVISEHAPGSIKTIKFEDNSGRKVAVDVSICVYQLLYSVRSPDGTQMQTQNGETTSHLIGIFYRTIRLISNGIKPVYVFDGKPPDMKMGELVKRSERRAADFERALSRAIERGEVDTFEKNIVQVTREHFDEVKRLLTLMGVPIVEAPSEAEAQCAELVKGGKVHASVTEDMDALAFGSNILLRNIFGDETKRINVKEFNLKRVLDGMKLTMNQFIDFCILLGCDYCGSIRGIGPKKAFELIKRFQSIEAILENIDTERYVPPENWPYAQARELLMSPDVIPAEQIQLQWKDPDTEGIVEFMCREKNFDEGRVRISLARLKKFKVNGAQLRIDSFFKVTRIIRSEPTSATKKRKLEVEQKKKRSIKMKPNSATSAATKQPIKIEPDPDFD